MGEIILVTGGCRSGKSDFAQRMAEALPGPRAYIATSPVIDREMEARVKKHREARQGKGWITIEEPVDLAGIISGAGECRTLLIDCLTLWINNILYEEERQGRVLSEEVAAGRCRELINCCREFDGTVIFVTNELGMGIVPDNELARRFRDIAGRCNREIAAAADTVTLVISGIAVHLKATNESFGFCQVQM